MVVGAEGNNSIGTRKQQEECLLEPILGSLCNSLSLFIIFQNGYKKKFLVKQQIQTIED